MTFLRTSQTLLRTRHRPAEQQPQTRARRVTIVGALAVAVIGSTLAPITAQAATPEGISVVGGKTEAVFDYETAVRERVFIPVEGVDQDRDGVTDVTAIDIIRPKESDGALKVPAIIDPSPYYTTVGRGNESQLLTDNDGDGAADLFPLFYDNYFVPRGYAVIHAQMDGTGNSTGCPMHGGEGDIKSMKVVIDWLQGRVPGYDSEGAAQTATWHSGKAAMIGKSYDGTLSNGVAATGVPGLTTIVPIAAISDWYRYSRTNGIRHNTNYPAGLSNNVTNPDRKDLCAPTRDEMNLVDGDETGDVNAFWDARNYQNDVDNVKASVFAVHGLNDDNVRMSQFGEWWSALAENNVPRKVWLPRLGHVDPFDARRAEWVDTLHKWFDFWLMDVQNGIMSEPQATVEMQPNVWQDAASWPAPGTENVSVNLAGTEPGTAGDLLLAPGTGAETLTFTGPANAPNETSLITAPEGQQGTRLTFLSEPLTKDLRISGTPIVNLSASLSQGQSNLAAMLVDYGTAARTPRGSGDGVQNTANRSCWGAQSQYDNACYLEVERRTATADFWRASRGVLDSSNRDTLVDGQATPVTPGQKYDFEWPLEPYDQVFPAGHRIGVVVTTNLSGFVAGTPSATVTVDAKQSSITLPVVGGLAAAAAAEGLGAPAPSTLSFDLGGQGTAIEPQTVAYGSAPVEPAEPTDDDRIFAGWFADAGFTVPFDFAAPLAADATVYARWFTVAQATTTVEVTASDTTVDQGDTVTLTAEGFDADGASLGDVTDLATFTSSVATDVIAGNTVTFPTASPHTLTATVGTATGSVLIEVTPAAVPTPDPTAPPVDGGATPAPPVTGDPAGQPPVLIGGSGLPVTGAAGMIPLGTAAAVLLLAGAAFMMLRRRQRLAAASTTADGPSSSEEV